VTTKNPITGDEIKTKVTSKEYEDGYDRIFKKKPQSLDAAYERRAMMQGLIISPLFDENKELIEDRTGLVTNPLFEENKERIPVGAQVIIGVDHSKDGDTTVKGFYDPDTGEYHINEYLRYCHGRDEYSHLGTLVKEVEWPESEERIDVIGQNGPDGLVYGHKPSCNLLFPATLNTEEDYCDCKENKD
jgi:hypothetical protein